jgi:diacylglycerol kinase
MKTSLLRSFANAFRGLAVAFRTERSFRIQCFAALVVLAVIVVLPLETWERVMLLLVVAFVLVLELVNSSLERLTDLAKPRLHAYAGEIKDLMAGGVLVASILAVVVGILILVPHFLTLISRV